MSRKKRLPAAVILAAVVLLCALPCMTADAAVTSTPEAAGDADTVYVAGNPDWYPVEYYDRDSKTYAGILPEILELVSAKTGVDFTYIQAGTEDQRQRLAKNGQVEMISGCLAGDAWIRENGLRTSEPLLCIPGAGGETEACLVFSQIADEALIQRVEKALAEMTDQEIAGLSVRFAMEHPAKSNPHIAAVWIGGILVLLILSIIQALRLRHYRKALRQDSRVDLLTGMGNKACFTEFFNTRIPDQYRSLYCVVYIGFDIVRVNQYYGEKVAEEQLCFAANELQLSVRENDAAARISGGGFAVIRPGSGEQEAVLWTEQLLGRLNQYMEQYGKDYRPDFRAGIYMLQPTDRDCDRVLLSALQGYQQAVRAEQPYALARPEHLELEQDRLQLKKRILEALRNREFRMYLQFVVRGRDGKICGAEAVSRWEHPQKGLLYPDSYIGLLESEGTITELDFYMFEEVCRRLERWRAEQRNLILSCNFARVTTGRKDFVQRIREIADRYTFNRAHLIIEITEGAMDQNGDIAFSNIHQCKEMGFLIALDDVGNGHTSFADLRDYPINIVKIDRSILEQAALTERGAALLRGITALAHNLNMEVLCEGAETQGQVELIRETGCDYIQGYYFYRPLPSEEAEKLF